MPFAQACTLATTHTHDYLDAYVADLGSIIDFDAIRGAGLKHAVDPLGGAGVHYWAPIAERYKLDLTVVSEEVDPQFAFMTVDWDGRIRMDPSSKYAMQRLLGAEGQVRRRVRLRHRSRPPRRGDPFVRADASRIITSSVLIDYPVPRTQQLGRDRPRSARPWSARR